MVETVQGIPNNAPTGFRAHYRESWCSVGIIRKGQALHILMEALASRAKRQKHGGWPLSRTAVSTKISCKTQVWLGLTTGFGLELSVMPQNNWTWDTLADHSTTDAGEKCPGSSEASCWGKPPRRRSGGGQEDGGRGDGPNQTGPRGHRDGSVGACRASRKVTKTPPPPTEHSCQIKIKQEFDRAFSTGYHFTGKGEDKEPAEWDHRGAVSETQTTENSRGHTCPWNTSLH